MKERAREALIRVGLEACKLYPDSAFRWTEAACRDCARDGK